MRVCEQAKASDEDETLKTLTNSLMKKPNVKVTAVMVFDDDQ